jgi:hypothetical protein
LFGEDYGEWNQDTDEQHHGLEYWDMNLLFERVDAIAFPKNTMY